jgi:arginyl-tRNA synthetase
MPQDAPLPPAVHLSRRDSRSAGAKITWIIKDFQGYRVVLELQKRLGRSIRAVLKEKYDLEVENIPLETPPDLRFGEIATPIAFELARKLRKAPKIIAQEIVAALGAVDGFAGFEVAGAGYINARLDRAAVIRLVAAPARHSSKSPLHALVEHTSINPNKAAHIGHLRNAILGDTFVRLLRAAGQTVDVQNYIDNTGVQVADVVVGFLHLEGKSVAEVHALIARCSQQSAHTADKSGAIDYYCWDLYARTSQWYEQGTGEEKASRKRLRLDTLHLIEAGGNETAEIADLISTAVLRRHLETMQRLGIEYDFLPRESEILHLKFWEAAFEQLKQTGVLYYETEGKNKGCWVMRRPGLGEKYLDKVIRFKPSAQWEDPNDSSSPEDRFEYKDELLRNSTEVDVSTDGPDKNAKVIVRSNGTVTYVGKDIAYHLWKFGLLGRDFGYRRFFSYPREDGPNHECWISAEHGEEPHPHFGGATAIYNVIDSRQSDPQANVIQALRGMGHTAEADHYTHFSYEMVALTPRCAVELGYEVSEEDLSRPYIEVSGRKGFGVKADDLIDKLIAATRAEVDARQTGGTGPDAEAVRQKIAEQIAIGALRYFMLKYTRNSVIAFDFKDALSFEGETGPYIQYAVVRIRNIFRKGNTTPEAALAEFARQFGVLKGHDFSRAVVTAKDEGALDPAAANLAAYLSGEENQDIWSLWLRAGRFSLVLEQCIAGSEPAYLAKHAFQLAQEFANFYHRHHILTEEDPARKAFLLATAAVTLRELAESLSLLGIESPEAM